MRSLVNCLVYSVSSQALESVFYNYCNELDRFEKLAISCVVPGAPAQGLAGVCARPALRHFADHVAHRAGVANGERIRRWFQEKLCREKRQGGM